MRTRQRFFALPPLVGDIPASLQGPWQPHREEFDTKEIRGVLDAWPRDLEGSFFWLSATPLEARVDDPDLCVTSAFVTAAAIARNRVTRQRGAFVVTKAVSDVLGVAPLRDRIDVASRGGSDYLMLGAQRLLVGGVDGLPYLLRPSLETVGVETFDGALTRPSSERWLRDDSRGWIYLVAHDETGAAEVLAYNPTNNAVLARRLDERFSRPFHLALSEERLCVIGPNYLQLIDRDLATPGGAIVPVADLAIERILGARETDAGFEISAVRRRRHGLKLATITIDAMTCSIAKISDHRFSSISDLSVDASSGARRIIGVEAHDGDEAVVVSCVDLDLGSIEQRRLPVGVLAGQVVMAAGSRSAQPYAIVPTNRLDGHHPELLLLDAQHIGAPEIASLQLAHHLPLDGQGIFIPSTQLR